VEGNELVSEMRKGLKIRKKKKEKKLWAVVQHFFMCEIFVMFMKLVQGKVTTPYGRVETRTSFIVSPNRLLDPIAGFPLCLIFRQE